MPEMLAVHYGANGAPNRVAAKSVGTAFSLVFVQIGVTALLAGIAAAIFHSRPDLDPAHPVGSARWYRQYMSLGAKALLELAAMIDVDAGIIAADVDRDAHAVGTAGGRAPDPGRRRGCHRGPGRAQPGAG
jgi:uncharacterized membrane protein